MRRLIYIMMLLVILAPVSAEKDSEKSDDHYQGNVNFDPIKGYMSADWSIAVSGRRSARDNFLSPR